MRGRAAPPQPGIHRVPPPPPPPGKCSYEIDEKQKAVLQNIIERIGFNAVDFSYCSLSPVDFAAVSQLKHRS